MSSDLRNSIYLWAATIAFVGAFWAALKYDLLERVSDAWLWPAVGALALINGVWFVIGALAEASVESRQPKSPIADRLLRPLSTTFETMSATIASLKSGRSLGATYSPIAASFSASATRAISVRHTSASLPSHCSKWRIA